MRYSHVFVARPLPESMELAALLAPLGLQVVIQPAFDFRQQDIAESEPGLMEILESTVSASLLVFTSPRSVSFGLPQIPRGFLNRCKIAAIGPSTSKSLEAAGVRVNIQPEAGFTSEALLASLRTGASGISGPVKTAYIVAAPGGRRKIEQGLNELGWDVQMLMVYQRENADIGKKQLEELAACEGLLSVWTSSNAMKSLSQRLPSSAWFRICQGDWLVISNRLKRLARAYGPAEVHLSPGPGNSDILTAIRTLNFRQ